jgi:hypothetical protein
MQVASLASLRRRGLQTNTETSVIEILSWSSSLFSLTDMTFSAVAYNYVGEEKKTWVLQSSTNTLHIIQVWHKSNELKNSIKLQFREPTKLRNGFSCSAAHVRPAQNLNTNVIPGAVQLCSGSRKTMWALQFCTRAARFRMQLNVNGSDTKVWEPEPEPEKECKWVLVTGIISIVASGQKKWTVSIVFR